MRVHCCELLLDITVVRFELILFRSFLEVHLPRLLNLLLEVLLYFFKLRVHLNILIKHLQLLLKSVNLIKLGVETACSSDHVLNSRLLLLDVNVT